MLEYTQRQVVFPPSPDNGFADTLLQTYNGQTQSGTMGTQVLSAQYQIDGL